MLGIAPRSGRVLPVMVVAEIARAGRLCGASEPAANSPSKARRPTVELTSAVCIELSVCRKPGVNRNN